MLPGVPRDEDVVKQAILWRRLDLTEALPPAASVLRPARTTGEVKFRLPGKGGRRGMAGVDRYPGRPLIFGAGNHHPSPVLQPAADKTPSSHGRQNRRHNDD